MRIKLTPKKTSRRWTFLRKPCLLQARLAYSVLSCKPMRGREGEGEEEREEEREGEGDSD